jgi:large subunit ribosomal protein L15
MPIHRRLPKRGFKNIHGARFSEVGLDTLQAAIDKKILDASKPVTEAALKEAGVITHLRDGVRLLGNGEIKAKIALEVSGATASAKAAIEAAGGTLRLTRVRPEKPAKEKSSQEEGRAAAAGEAGAEEEGS